MKISLLGFTIVKRKKYEQLSVHNTLLHKEVSVAAEFINNIEKGKLDINEIEKKNEEFNSSLISALISMRNQLVKIQEEENERNWVREGLARFVDVLRVNHNSLSELSDQVLTGLVKYTGANQGGLFILNDQNSSDLHLELVSCYAYQRKKFLDKRVEIGEGLVGQCYLEAERIVLTEVPRDYINITSGLGDAPPGFILIVPLKANDKVLGVLEIASFTVFKKYQIEFIEKLSENIASAISNMKVNEQTKTLLEETQMSAEKMRSQEEELRQNLEELHATQEQMKRQEDEMMKNMQDIMEQMQEEALKKESEYQAEIEKLRKLVLTNN